MTWAKLRRECFHCAQAPNKWQNEEKKKINYISYLVEPRKRLRIKKKKMLFFFFNVRTMKSNAVCNFEFIFSHCETGLQRKERRHRNLNSTNKLYRKKWTFECAGRFSDFFIKKWRKQSLEKKTRMSSFNIKLILFSFFLLFE